jgi:RNase P/RNase MRP subunit p29
MEKKIYTLSVAEPWDFESPDGQNLIKGKIIKILTNQCVIFQTSHTLNFDNYTNNILVLTLRNNDVNFSELSNKRVLVNGNLLLEEYSDKLKENELKEKSKFIIIGSISLLMKG